MPQYTLDRVQDFELNQGLPNNPASDFTNNNSDRFPETIRLADGDFLVLWRSPQNTALDPDRPVGTAIQRFNPNGTPDGAYQNFPGLLYNSVAALPDGGWVMAGGTDWVRFNAAGSIIAGGAVGTPADQGFATDIATLADGGWVVSWSHNVGGGGGYALYAQIFSSAGVAGAVTPLNAVPVNDGDAPSLSALSGGGYAATWVVGNFGDDRNLHISYNGVESVVDGASTIYQSDVATLPDGRLILTWAMANGGSATDIYAAFVATDGSVGTPFLAGNGLAVDAAPRVAVFGDGRFVIVWGGGYENYYAVYGQAYAADGTPLNPAGPVQIGASPSEADFSVTVISDSDFVVAWAPVGTSDRTLNGTRYHLVQAATFTGTPGPDTYHGGASDDTLLGMGGSDSLYGHGGNDTMSGGTDADYLEGGIGNDLYYVDNAGDVVAEVAGEGNDSVYTLGSYTLGLFSSIEYFATVDPGGTAALTLVGSRAGQTIVGNAGANSIFSGYGAADMLVGMGGNDVYYVDAQGSTVMEAVGGGSDQVYTSSSFALSAGSEVELLSTNSHAASVTIDLTGNEFGQTLAGNQGANRLDGRGGADYMVGFGGNDTYIVDNAGDLVDEAGAGNSFDVVIASVSYTLVGGVQIDELRAFDPTGYSPIDLYGNSFAQLIVGNAAANTLYGRGGADILRGLEGNDTYLIDTAGTLIEEVGNQGNDAIYTGVSYALSGNVYVETLSTNNHAATVAIDLTGNGINQTLVGNQGANSLHGGGGVDELIGFGGNDTYFTDVAATLAWESAGGGNDALYTSVSYTLQAGTQIETLSTSNHGATAAIDLTGNEIGQAIIGNAGANILDGKGGADYLTGFGGADIYAFTTALGGGNVDTIIGFSTVDDTIALDDAVFTGIGGLGALNANAFNTGSGAADASDRIIYNSSTGALYYDSDGNGAGAAIQFATVGTGLTLSASDFMVI